MPVLNEAAALEILLGDLEAALPGEQWIFCDGGSRDGTCERLRGDPRLILLSAPPSRGGQMATGLEHATGTHVLLLHADCRLPAGARGAMETLLLQPGVSAGVFRFAVAHEARRYRWMECLVDWRTRHLGLPYGDQGLFVSRDLLLAVGGIDSIPLMEDVSLLRRLRRAGRVAQTDLALPSSSRRFESRGFWRSCARNLSLLLLYQAGLPPTRLARWYS